MPLNGKWRVAGASAALHTHARVGGPAACTRAFACLRSVGTVPSAKSQMTAPVEGLCLGMACSRAWPPQPCYRREAR
jgi:hypothetical protein